MVSVAEKKLAQCSYTGYKSKWTFEKYATLHKEHHNILDSLKEHMNLTEIQGQIPRASILLASNRLRPASYWMKACVTILTDALRCTRTL